MHSKACSCMHLHACSRIVLLACMHYFLLQMLARMWCMNMYAWHACLHADAWEWMTIESMRTRVCIVKHTCILCIQVTQAYLYMTCVCASASITNAGMHVNACMIMRVNTYGSTDVDAFMSYMHVRYLDDHACMSNCTCIICICLPEYEACACVTWMHQWACMHAHTCRYNCTH